MGEKGQTISSSSVAFYPGDEMPNINCPQCGHVYEVQPTLEGSFTRCPRCNAGQPTPVKPDEAHQAPTPREGNSFSTHWSNPATRQTDPPPGPPPILDEQSHPPDYEILEELGRGGMGVVYKARHQKLGRLVALKMILTGAQASVEERDRFQREAQAVARLQHQNIVQIFEIGEHRQLPFCALELCRGGNLTNHLARGLPEPGQAAELVEALARAMHVVHERKIVHRDLKPGNVLLTTEGIPKITDFGLAKQLDQATRTKTGALLGTPAYMAPEQARGEKETSPAVDIYALGAILYECLTAKPPFKAADSLDTLLQVISEEPVPLRQLNSRVPRDLETICLKCLEKDPRRRYSTALGLAEDLHRFRAGEPIRARAVSRVERSWRWCKRHPGVASLTGLVAFLLLALSVGGAWAALWFRDLAGEKEQAFQEKHAALEETEQLLQERNAALGTARAQKKNAEQAATTARQEALKARLQEARRSVRNSWVAYDHDPVASLPWFAHALELVQGDPRQERLARIRLGTLLKRYPLSQMWFNVRFALLNPSGEWLATTSAEGRARVWELSTGQPVTPVLSHGPVPGAEQGKRRANNALILRAAFAADSRRLATAGIDGSAGVWELPSGKLLHAFKHDKAVWFVAFAPEGDLITAQSDDTVQAWSLATGKKRGPSWKHEPILAWSRDGQFLVTCQQVGPGPPRDQPLRIPVPPPREKATASVPISQPGLAWPRGSAPRPYQWVSFQDEKIPPPPQRIPPAQPNPVVVRAARTGEAICTVKPEGRVERVLLNQTGQHLLTVSDREEGQTIQVWEIPSGKSAGPPISWRGFIRALSLSPDGQQVRLLQWGEVSVFETRTGNRLPTIPVASGEVRAAWFSRDGKRLITARPLSIQEAPPYSGQPQVPPNRVPPPREPRKGEPGVWRPGGRTLRTQLVSAQPGNLVVPLVAQEVPRDAVQEEMVQVWDLSSGAPLTPRLRHRGTVAEGLFTPDGQRALIRTEGSAGGEARLWDLRDRPGTTLVRPLSGSQHGGQILVDAREPYVILDSFQEGGGGRRMWELSTGKVVQAPPRPPYTRVTVTEYVPVLFTEKVAVSVVTPKGQQVRQEQARTRCEFRPLEKELLADDQTLKALEKRKLHPLRMPRMPAASDPLSFLAFSPDYRWLVTRNLRPGANYNDVRVWDAQTGTPITPPLKHLSSSEFAFLFHNQEKVTRAVFSPDQQFLVTITTSARFEEEQFKVATANLERVLPSRWSDLRVWDVKTGSLLTILHHNRKITDAWFAGQGRYLVTRDSPPEPLLPGEARMTPSDLLHVWDLSPDARPLEELALWTHVLSGRGIDRTVSLKTLSPRELHSEWEKLQFQRRPQGSPLAWHEQKASACESQHLWGPALLHLQRLAEAEPTHWQVHARCGNALAEQGQWEEAVSALNQAKDRGADTPVWYQLAVAQRARGDEERFREVCQDLRERFSASDNPAEVEQVLRACTLAAGAVANWDSLLEQTQGGLAKQPEPRYRLTLAQAHYRAGRFDEAIAKLETLRSAKPESALDPVERAEVHLSLALAYAQRDQRKKAWVVYSEVASLLDRIHGINPEEELWVPWDQWQRLKVLQEETMRMIFPSSGGVR